MSIEAMKLALDALDPRLGMPEPEYESLLRCALGELRAAIQQAEQEPVAYWHRDPNLDPEEYDGMLYFPDDCEGHCANCTPLYTAPPQREWMEQERAVGYREGHQAALKQRVWQGLTDQEINILFKNSLKSVPESVIWNISRDIEAKLKEKNNG